MVGELGSLAGPGIWGINVMVDINLMLETILCKKYQNFQPELDLYLYFPSWWVYVLMGAWLDEVDFRPHRFILKLA